MNLDWPATVSFMKDVWWFATGVLALMATGGMFYLRSQFPTKVQHDQQTATLQGSIAALQEHVTANERAMEQRVGKLEGDLRQLPNRDEVQALGERIGRVEKEVATSIETTRGVEKTVTKIDHTLSLILKHLLEGKSS
jgi:cytochrome c-type biogenesis protein CcmH/NrfG